MSRRAITLATRDQLRLAPATPPVNGGLGLNANSSDVMYSGEPAPRTGKVFYAVHRGSRQNTCRHSLDETYEVLVTITERVNEPYDRVGTDLIEKAVVGMDDRADALRAVVHMSYAIMNAANAYILAAYVAAGGTGIVYGFSEPLYFMGDNSPRIVGPDWFKAVVEETSMAPLGVAMEVRFGGARRLQPIWNVNN